MFNSTSDFIQHYPHINGSTNFTLLQPHIRVAQRLHLAPFIGEDVLAALHESHVLFYNTYTAVGLSVADVQEMYFLKTITDPNTPRLIALENAYLTILDSAARYTIYVALPYLPTIVSNTGISGTTAKETTPLQLRDRSHARYNAHIEADKLLDAAMTLLDTANLEAWSSFIANRYPPTAIITGAHTLASVLTMQHSYRAYLALLPYIRTAENTLQRKVGIPTYTAIIENAALHRVAQRFVAYTALKEATPFLTLVFEGDGFFVLSKGDGVDERNSMKSKEHLTLIQNLIQSAEKMAQDAYSELQTLLLENGLEILNHRTPVIIARQRGGVFFG